MEVAILNAPVSRSVTLAKVDGRSALGRLMRQVRSDLIRHVGGKPSATHKMLIERAATLTGYLARLDGEALSPAGLSDHRRREYLAADGALRRTLRDIGLEGADTGREPTIADLLVRQPKSANLQTKEPLTTALAPAKAAPAPGQPPPTKNWRVATS